VNSNDPIAFLSYVRADDDHERGRITALRARLEGEVRMQTGQPFTIFQDKKDILWGQHWRERLDIELLNVTFLIPVVTPSYFRSVACRDEFGKFAVREKQLGKNALILPIYYLEADELREVSRTDDEVAEILSQRNWADWRDLRFKDIQSPDVECAIAMMARTIKAGMRTLEAEILAAEQSHKPPKPPYIPRKTEVADLTHFSPEVPEARAPGGTMKKITSSGSAYYAYTKAFDEIVNASELIDADSTSSFRARLSRTRRVLSKEYAEQIDQATQHLRSTPIKRPSSVTFLVDNSGSMKEHNGIAYIAAWLNLLVEALERLEIPSEVLGFTTRTWKGGMSREQWITDGKPEDPGRLNDLRHIIYKAFDQTSDETLDSFSLMASGRLLKENIDGEALLWAFDRAQDSAAQHSIIIAISDGAPVDDSTLASNAPGILSKHLEATIHWLSQVPNLSLYGVGIAHDTSAFYPQGLHKTDPKSMGLGVLRALPNWLNGKA